MAADDSQTNGEGLQWQKVLEFIQTQTSNDWARFERIFKYTAGAISLIAAVGIWALVYFVGHSLSEGREEMRKVTTLEVENMRTEIRKRIESEFQTPQIRSVVSNVARERTGEELNAIIRQEISQQVQLAVKQQEGTIQEEVRNETRRAVLDLKPTIQTIASAQVGARVDEAVRPLDSAVSAYKEIVHAASIATTATAGSRSAYRELTALVSSPNQDVHQIASWALESVNDELFDMLRGQTLNSELKPEELLDLSSQKSPTLRLKAVERMGIIKDRRYIPRIVEIVKSDPNIRVLRAALMAFNRETGVSVTSDEAGAVIVSRWWEQHKSEFTK